MRRWNGWALIPRLYVHSRMWLVQKRVPKPSMRTVLWRLFYKDPCGLWYTRHPYLLTGGEASDYTQALALLDGMAAKAILADTGYDADDVVKAAEFRGAEGAMASKSNRKNPRHFDKVLYRKPNFIEILLREYSINSRISVMLPPVTIQQTHLVLLLSWSQAFAYGLNNISTRPSYKLFRVKRKDRFFHDRGSHTICNKK